MMDSKHGHLLLGYWSGLRARESLLCDPDEDAILAYLAPYFFVLHISPGREPVYWISGRMVRDVLGENPYSKSYYDYWDSGSRPVLRSLLEESIEAEEPVCLTSSFGLADGQVAEIETVLVPVLFAKEAKSILLGVSVPDDTGRFRSAGPVRQTLKRSGFAYDKLRGRGGVVVHLDQNTRPHRL